MPGGRVLVAVALVALTAGCTSGKPWSEPAAPTPATAYAAPEATSDVPTVDRPTAPRPSSTRRTSRPARPGTPARSSPTPRPTRATPPSTMHPHARTGAGLPLGYSTGSATQVITVVARSTYSTTATVQAWTSAGHGRWLKHGPAISAWVGSQGLTAHPSESRSATPMGSFTLTTAFGYYANPGTGLSYFQTTTADWWISQSGKLYNTHQRCSSHCSFTQGDPNEHLLSETPAYNYAVVIDYNTANTGHVTQHGGSAFFFHVSTGSPTAGCVSVDQSSLVLIMRWLSPAKHPRILIGVG
jgi:L,D-peptidoglycan transpeptidase YkuD (ErfK/YbiS/YcfS/YnhG family)